MNRIGFEKGYVGGFGDFGDRGRCCGKFWLLGEAGKKM